MAMAVGGGVPVLIGMRLLGDDFRPALARQVGIREVPGEELGIRPGSMVRVSAEVNGARQIFILTPGECVYRMKPGEDNRFFLARCRFVDGGHSTCEIGKNDLEGLLAGIKENNNRVQGYDNRLVIRLDLPVRRNP